MGEWGNGGMGEWENGRIYFILAFLHSPIHFAPAAAPGNDCGLKNGRMPIFAGTNGTAAQYPNAIRGVYDEPVSGVTDCDNGIRLITTELSAAGPTVALVLWPGDYFGPEPEENGEGHPFRHDQFIGRGGDSYSRDRFHFC